MFYLGKYTGFSQYVRKVKNSNIQYIKPNNNKVNTLLDNFAYVIFLKFIHFIKDGWIEFATGNSNIKLNIFFLTPQRLK